jgi:methyl-accepting chemotaxis protein
VEENRARLEREFNAATRRIMLKAALSAITIPLLVLAMFSLTIFRFKANQYGVFVLAVVAVVIPFVLIFYLSYMALQRRLLRRLLSWYAEERDEGSREDRALALNLQRNIDAASYRNGVMVSGGIFSCVALSVLIFGRFADFSEYMAVSYIALGFLLGITDYFITLFISHREMRPVLKVFLHDCQGFGYYSAAGIGRRLATFALVILLLTVGITWIASSYISSELLQEELEDRGNDNVRLLAYRLDTLIAEDASDGELEEAAGELAMSDTERLVVYDARGRAAFVFTRGEIGDLAWDELTTATEDVENTAFSRFEQVGNREYLVTGAPLTINEGWMVYRVDIPETAFHALGHMSPTMLLLLIIGAGVAFYLTLLMTHNLADPIKQLVRTCRVVATGDLSVDVTVDSLDDVGELTSSYSDMMRSLRHISSELRETSGEVSQGAVGIVAVSEQIMAAIEELNALVQDLSEQIMHEVDQIRTVEEIMNSVAETISMSHATASQSHEISQDAERLVTEGRGHAREAVEKIADFRMILDDSMEAILSLGESSQKIGTIVDIITRIADQTNLLALNAAIEAARVPEYGKGFAVVADEVKKLAQEASGSAQRIHDLVRVIQEDVEKAKSLMERGTMSMYVGMETVERTDSSLLSISDIVNQMARMAGAIAEASAREFSESERLSESLKAMKDSVEATAGGYEEIGASSQEQASATTELAVTAERLSEIANRLQEMVAHFKLH